MTLTRLNNVDRFLKLTREIHGDVLVDLPDGSQCSLRNNTVAREMLRSLSVKNTELKLSITDKRDLPRMVDFMISDCA